MLLTVVTLLLALGIAVIVAAHPDHRGHEVLIPRHLQNAVFAPPPPLPTARQAAESLWADLRSPGGSRLLLELVPSQSGVLWIALLVALTVAFDFQRPCSGRNLELAALLLVGFLLFNVMRFFDLFHDPVYFRLMDWVFSAVVAVSVFLAARAVWRFRFPAATPWVPNLPTRALTLLTLLLLGLNICVGLVREPDDAGFYTNLGAQRLRERAMFPYGDRLLSGSAGAGYGPVLFLAHLPFQLLIDPQPVNPDAGDKPDLEHGPPYYLPPVLATQLTVVAFHLLGVAALILAARGMAGAPVAWGIGALYCGSAYVIGIGGGHETIGGMTFISHIAPPALALAAFAALSRPLLSGALLALSVATTFYALFLIPAWLGYYWPRRHAAWQFLGGIALAAVIVGVPVLARSEPLPGRTVIGTVIQETVGHHQGADAYGQSPFGFWGQRGGLRAWLRTSLVGNQVTTSPMFLIGLTLALLAFFPARGASVSQLALLSGALAIVAQLWKIHGTAVYVNWYYPFLLLGFFGAAARPRQDDVHEKP